MGSAGGRGGHDWWMGMGMSDALFYTILISALVGVILAAIRDLNLPGCYGNCEQGDKPCNCRPK